MLPINDAGNLFVGRVHLHSLINTEIRHAALVFMSKKWGNKLFTIRYNKHVDNFIAMTQFLSLRFCSLRHGLQLLKKLFCYN